MPLQLVFQAMQNTLEVCTNIILDTITEPVQQVPKDRLLYLHEHRILYQLIVTEPGVFGLLVHLRQIRFPLPSYTGKHHIPHSSHAGQVLMIN